MLTPVVRRCAAQTGAPPGSPDAYAKPKPKPLHAGPFQPVSESLRDAYRTPDWFGYQWPVGATKLRSFAAGRATVERVGLVGGSPNLKFKQKSTAWR